MNRQREVHHCASADNCNAPAGYIDLSKRRVSPDDVIHCEERYTKSKTVHNIMAQAAQRCQYPIEKLYEEICWPLDKRFGHAFDAFKLSIT